MDKAKQIDEIALDLNSIIYFKDNGLVARYATAEAMYEIGYRKQSEGEWIKEEPWDVRGCVTWRCSVCKETFRDKTKYCPECGTNMKGGTK